MDIDPFVRVGDAFCAPSEKGNADRASAAVPVNGTWRRVMPTSIGSVQVVIFGSFCAPDILSGQRFGFGIDKSSVRSDGLH